MGKTCDRCGRKFSILYKKHKTKNGEILCIECVDKERKQIISDIVKRYLKGKNYEDYGIIQYFYQNRDLEGDLFSEWHKDSLEQVRSKYQLAFNNADAEHDFDLKVVTGNALTIIDELEKIKKLVEKKVYETDFDEIIAMLYNGISDVKQNIIEESINPFYKRILNKYGNNPSIDCIIKDFLSIEDFNTYDEEELENVFLLIIGLLDKFRLDYDEKEVKRLITEYKEEMDLKEFEENLTVKKQNTYIDNFEALNGYKFESYLKEIFEKMGYIVVDTPLSGDQGADLIMSKDGVKTVVQVKKYNGKVSNKAIQEVVAAKNHYHADHAMVVTNSTFTKSAIELSMSNNVELIDGQKLREIIEENNSNGKTISNSGKVNKIGDRFIANCPFCESEIQIPISQLPQINKRKKITCKDCKFDLTLTIPEDQYICDGCGKRFNSIQETFNHKEKCEKLDDRRFQCQYCNEILYLDDDELKNLAESGSITVTCPICKKSMMLKN